jgi:glycosyltransferase involved in cell wall biosynthesis
MAAANYHIVLHQKIDLDEWERKAQAGQCPRHAMQQLAHRLGALVHVPPERRPLTLRDRWRCTLGGTAEMWDLAENVLAAAQPTDVIYCNSEASGLPIAALCRGRRDRPRIAVFVHNLDRPRGRVALRLFGAASGVDWFVGCSRHQVDFLRDHLKLPAGRSTFIWDQTDLRFFAPGPASPAKARPVVMSVGLEQRDYRTLAAATADLPVDVRISGYSRDAKAMAQAFPDTMPANMTRRYYEWPELLQLYRDADVVVVSTFASRYAAGVQGMMEAMACARPVIVTETEGLRSYLSGHHAAVKVPPGDPAAMRQAITRLLASPAEADRLAQSGLALARKRHDSDRHVETLARGLEALRALPGGGVALDDVRASPALAQGDAD